MEFPRELNETKVLRELSETELEAVFGGAASFVSGAGTTTGGGGATVGQAVNATLSVFIPNIINATAAGGSTVAAVGVGA